MSEKEKTISPKSIYDFMKAIIEVAGYWKIDDATGRIMQDSGEPAGVTVHGKPKQIVLFGENMQINQNQVILNIFKEQLSTLPERQWFFIACGYQLNMLVGEVINSIIGATLHECESDDTYDKTDIIAKFGKQIDDKTLDEFEKIKAKSLPFAEVIYHKSPAPEDSLSDNKKVREIQERGQYAYLRCTMLNPDFQKGFKTTIRKKTWKLMADIMNEILQTNCIEEDYIYKSSIVNLQECEAYLNVYIKALDAMHHYVNLLTGCNMEIGELLYGLDHLEEYRKASCWFVSNTAGSAEVTDARVPWSSRLVASSSRTKLVPSSSGGSRFSRRNSGYSSSRLSSQPILSGRGSGRLVPATDTSVRRRRLSSY